MPQTKSSSEAAPQLSPSKLSLIHVAKRQLSLSDEDYRSILGLYGGVTSAAMLDQQGFDAVMERFTELGFRSTSKRRPMPLRAGMASPAQVQLMRNIWAECTDGEGTDASLGKWLERQFKVSALRFVTAELAPKVLGGLKAMKAKQRAKRQAQKETQVA